MIKLNLDFHKSYNLFIRSDYIMEKEYYKTVVKITAEEIALLLKNINFSSFKDEDVISYTIDKKDLSYLII